MTTKSLAVIQPLWGSTGPTEYYIMMPKSWQIWLHVSQLEPDIQDYKLPWVMSKYKPGLMLGTTWRMTHLTILCISNRKMARFCLAVPWMLDLWSSHQTGFVESFVKMNIKFCYHLCWSTSMINRHNPLQCTAIPFTWFWFSTTIPLSWLCPPMICVCHHNLRNCCSGYT